MPLDSERTSVVGTTHTVCLEPLALRPKDAAQALGISERLLWSLTNQGVIPHIRLGKVVLYSVDALREWLAQRASGKGVPPR